MTTHEILTAINAYAEAQAAEGSKRSWLALTHRSNRSTQADAARAIRDAGRDALDEIQDWQEVERIDGQNVLLQGPDGSRLWYRATYPADANGGVMSIERVELA